MLHCQSLSARKIGCRCVSFLQKPAHPKRRKIYKPCEALADIKDGSTILVGGFGLCGSPEVLLNELDHQQRTGLTLVVGDAGNDEGGLGQLLRHRRVKCLVTSHVRHSKVAQEMFARGELELQLVPQGTLSERLRAAAAGIAAFYTPVGVGSEVEQGGSVTHRGNEPAITSAKECHAFEGRQYVLETALRGDFALVRAWKADVFGNLCFRGTARGFNDTMCGAAKVTISETEELLPPGGLPPEVIHMPGALVKRLVKVKVNHRFENLTLMPASEVGVKSLLPDLPSNPSLDVVLRRVAWELQDCSSLYIGPGCPSQFPRIIIPEPAVRVLTTSGALGIGPFPETRDEVDAELVDGSKRTVMAQEGISFVSSHQSASMLRGGHIDLVVLGAAQISQYGDIACNPEDALIGTMDAAAAHDAGSRVVCMMGHLTADGLPALVDRLSMPTTAEHCVDLLITEKAVFQVDAERGLHLIEIAQGVSIEYLTTITGAEFTVTDSLIPIMQFVEAK